MGGHAAGEVAKRDGGADHLGSLDRPRSGDPAMRKPANGSATHPLANDAIFERTLRSTTSGVLGTTVTVLVLLPDRYLIGPGG